MFPLSTPRSPVISTSAACRALMLLAAILLGLPGMLHGQSPDLNTSGPVQVGGTSVSPDSIAPPEYLLGPGDVVAVIAYGAHELDRTTAVAANGDITISYLKDPVRARGLTAATVADEIAASLKSQQILVDPQVSVTVLSVRSHAITISGAVKKPMVIYATTPIRLLDAILQAGGPDSLHAGGDVLLSRPVHPDQNDSPFITEKIAYANLATAGNGPGNPLLHGGESVELISSGEIFVAGSVKTPGAFPIHQGENVGVAAAMALAGGWTQEADPNKAVLVRTYPDGTRKFIPLNLDKIMQHKLPEIPLTANDLIYVPQNGIKGAGLFALKNAVTSGFWAIGLLISHG